MGEALIAILRISLCVLLLQAFFLSRGDDTDVLVRFKTWIALSGSEALSSWQRSNSPSLCSWTGISCVLGIRRVEAINLAGKGLQFSLRDGLGSLTKLKYLNLSSNKITGGIPNDFSQLRNLETLDLSYNQLEGSIPKLLGTLPNLQVFVITGNSIGGLFPNNLCNAPQIRSIISSDNQLIGPLTDDLRNCSSLETFNIEKNKIATNFPRRLGNLKSLKYFNIAQNMFKGQIPLELADIAELTEVFLQHNLLTGTLPSSIGRCRYLINLDVSSNQLTGYIPMSFGNLILLEELRLANNFFQGNIPDELGALTSLKSRLDLSHNRLIGEIPATLGNLQMVAVMDMSNNLLTGQLPESIGSCSSLKELSVGGNGVTGDIPAGWVSLMVLETLNLSNNRLSGSISESLGYMVALSMIDLSHNSFSGEIPDTLTSLPNLRHLNVSANSLEGAIPSFASQTQVLLAGNPDLCGGSTNVPCPAMLQASTSVHFPEVSKLLGENAGIGLCIFIFLTIICPALWVISFRHFQPDKFDAMMDALQIDPPKVIVCIRQALECCVQVRCLRQRVTIQLVRTATNGLNDANIIGQGQKFTVYSAIWPEESPFPERKVVVKRLQESHHDQTQFYLQQTRALFHVQHCNVVRIVDWCSQSKELCVLVGCNVNGSLDCYLHNTDIVVYLRWQQRLKVVTNAANGLAYLHKNWWGTRIVHCNLQPSNVLLDENFEPQISGLRYCPRSDLKNMVCEASEACYMSPECIHGEPLTKESEVYSFGVFVFELLTRQAPQLCVSMLGMPLERWVRGALPSFKTQIIDHVVLQTAPTEAHVMGLVKVALSCTEEDPKLRPKISAIVRQLKRLSCLDYMPEGEELPSCVATGEPSSSVPPHSRFDQPITEQFQFFR